MSDYGFNNLYSSCLFVKKIKENKVSPCFYEITYKSSPQTNMQSRPKGHGEFDPSSPLPPPPQPENFWRKRINISKL